MIGPNVAKDDRPAGVRLRECIARHDCTRCDAKGTLEPADVTAFTLAGSDKPAGYKASEWSGRRCFACKNEIALGVAVIMTSDGCSISGVRTHEKVR